MKLNGNNYPLISVFPDMMTVPDCVVKDSNKLGKGHGEAKFYITSKSNMEEFYGFSSTNDVANCFMLKKDLISYLFAAKKEYFNPSQEYRKKDEMPELWEKRLQMVYSLPDVINFRVFNQKQISGPRGYVNSNDDGYKILRELALPLISYVCAEKLGTEENPIYYWRLFVDFEAIWQNEYGPLVFRYGQKKNQTTGNKVASEKSREYSRARIGQGKYREELLEQCPFCPITRITDERLLIASHIKPWAASDDTEKLDPNNGFMLSPMFDKLFDKGFITFTDDKRIKLSAFISNATWKLINIKNNDYIQWLPINDKRKDYLRFHREAVFKGSID